METKPTLQDLLERDKEKLGEIARLKESTTVAPEEMLLAEFGLYYGAEGIRMILNNEITDKLMNDLVVAARRVRAQNRYSDAVNMYMAFSGTQSDKGSSALKKYLREMSKEWQ